LTPHQRDVRTRVMMGILVIAWIGLLALLVRGYHTLVLILISVIFGIGALTFFYDRTSTLVWLAHFAAIGILSLMVQGYATLVLVIAGTVFSISALAFVYQLWQAWYPDEHMGPLVRRYGFRVLQLLAVALAYVQARGSINMLTGVDPGNFPTALAALTALLAIRAWLVVIAWASLLMLPVYLVTAYVAGLRREMDFTDLRGISPGGWAFRVFGVLSLVVICLMAFGLPAEHPSVQGAARIVASTVLIATEFSYDQTCALSSERRLVAQLKYRREMKTSIVSIAEDRGAAWWFLPFFRHVTFSRGACDDQRQP
jgi:hypothetical protein